MVPAIVAPAAIPAAEEAQLVVVVLLLKSVVAEPLKPTCITPVPTVVLVVVKPPYTISIAFVVSYSLIWALRFSVDPTAYLYALDH